MLDGEYGEWQDPSMCSVCTFLSTKPDDGEKHVKELITAASELLQLTGIKLLNCWKSMPARY